MSAHASSSVPVASGAVTAASGRKRPRHFHAGPQPTAVDEEEKQQEEIAGQPPSARLYRHALESIFAFLSLQELSSVLAVSRSWSSAVSSMRSIDAVVSLAHRLLVPLCASRLARHVGTLSSDDRESPLPVRGESLYLLTLRLVGLHSLVCEMVSPVTLPLLFPPSLTRLNVRMSEAMSPDDVDLVVAEACRIPRLTALKLLVVDGGELIDLAPLVRLPQLRELAMDGYGDSLWNLSKQQIDDLRALPHLETFTYLLGEDNLLELLQPPHTLQWQTLRLYAPGGSDPESKAAPLLASLPTLTDLEVVENHDVTFLQFTPNLRKLDVSNLLYESLTAHELLGGVGPCTQLTHLIIFNCSMNSALLRAFLSLMPILQTLELSHVKLLQSLDFLSLGSLQRSLTELTLVGCRHPALLPVELRHVFELQQLTHLTIRNSFAEKLDSFTKHLLQSRRTVGLPKLLKAEFSD